MPRQIARLACRHQTDLAQDPQPVGLAIDGLEQDPSPAGAKALQGLPYLRIRVGHVRITYAMDNAGLVIAVQFRSPDNFQALLHH